MATRIRLARGGRKKLPYYTIVVADARSPRDGKFIEKLGTYDPLRPKDDPTRVTLKAERVAYWLGTGAQPSERVAKFIAAAGTFAKPEKAPAKKAVKKAPAKKKVAAEVQDAKAAS